MKRIIILYILTITYVNITYSQQNTDTLNITNISILDVDFSKYNTTVINDLDLQAHVAFFSRNYKTAAQFYLKLLDYDRNNSFYYYQLARCYAKLNFPDYARNFLVLAINEGYTNYSNIRKDEHFNTVMGNQNFSTTFNEILNLSDGDEIDIYTCGEVLLKCKIVLPQGFDPEKNYILVVGLHGYGGNIDLFHEISDYVNKENIIFAFPEAPYLKPASLNRMPGYSWGIVENDIVLWEKGDIGTQKYILQVINQLKLKYNINKCYLLGFSQGAAYAYSVGIKNPDKVDGIIALSGRLLYSDEYPWFLNETDIKNKGNVAIFIGHGRRDAVISLSEAKKAKKILKEYKYQVEIEIFEDAHIVNPSTLNKALEWLNKKEAVQKV